MEGEPEGGHLKPVGLDAARDQADKMQETGKQMQSALSVNRRGSIDWTAATAARIADFAFAHALHATVTVAAAFGSRGSCRGWLGGRGRGRRERD